MIDISTILKTDSYKASHYLQYPPGTQYISSYLESRGGPFNEVVFFGLAPFLDQLRKPVTMQDVDEAKELFTAHGLPFNYGGWCDIVHRYGGDLPLEIQALKEGTVVSPGVPMVQLRNTDPLHPWVTAYVETMLVRSIWYPTTVATISREAKKVIYHFLKETADDPDAEINFKLHDFGARGVSSSESAMLGGMAHLVNFMGTDTVEALVGARRYYREPMAGFSIPASQHDTITIWGEDHEMSAHANMLDTFMSKPGMVASVSDSYNIYRCCEAIWCGGLKDKVQRYGERGGVVVVRPDSGDPVNTTFGVITRLADGFGTVTNSKGYKVLPPYVRMIQGDGVNLDSIARILANFMSNGFSASNIAFGMGGALLQQCNRDTLRFAQKTNEAVVDGKVRDVYKNPAHDPGKRSKAGRQAVIYNLLEDKYEAVREDTHKLGMPPNELEIVYKNGRTFRDESLADIRKRARIN